MYQENYFNQLKEVSRDIIKFYHNDLDVHIKRQLDSIQTDFIFACRRNGADLIKLVRTKQEIEAYFSPDEIKSLFDIKDFAGRFTYYKNFCLIWVYGQNSDFFVGRGGKVERITKNEVDQIAEKYFVHIDEYLNTRDAREVESQFMDYITKVEIEKDREQFFFETGILSPKS